MPITIDEFQKLPKEKPARAKVSNKELVDFLNEQACTTKEVAAFLGVQSGTAYSRLKRLKESGAVEVGYSGATAYWKTIPGAEIEEG